jgi:micrococcal nuclease
MRASSVLALLLACEPAESECGPARAVVERVIDGDTIELATGERVRYLLVDAPELEDCFGAEAAEANRRLVEGEAVTLRFDRECTDDYDRALAWVEVDGRALNLVLVERGLACVLHIPPNGDDEVESFVHAEAWARHEGRGMWGACEAPRCG